MIDNPIKAKTHFYKQLKPGFIQIRTLELQNPALNAFCLEYAVTNGLGYKPIRKVMQEGEIHTQEGLQAHLANMDYVVLWRESIAERAKAREYGRAMLELEDAYEKQRIISKMSFKLFLTETIHHMKHHYSPNCLERDDFIRGLLETGRLLGIDVSGHESEIEQLREKPVLRTETESAPKPARGPTQAQKQMPWYRRIFTN